MHSSDDFFEPSVWDFQITLGVDTYIIRIVMICGATKFISYQNQSDSFVIIGDWKLDNLIRSNYNIFFTERLHEDGTKWRFFSEIPFINTI